LDIIFVVFFCRGDGDGGGFVIGNSAAKPAGK
jgi:hypothetical protein